MSLRDYIYDNLSPLGVYIYDTIGSLLIAAAGIWLLTEASSKKEVIGAWAIIVFGVGYALFALFRYLRWRADNLPRRRTKRRRKRRKIDYEL